MLNDNVGNLKNVRWSMSI